MRPVDRTPAPPGAGGAGIGETGGPTCRRARVPAIVRLAIVIAGIVAPQLVGAASASLSADARTIHAGMPFTLTLTAKGFEESPTPDAPELSIEGCTVTWLGVSPSVSTHITIVNGQRSESREVTFNYQWRVLPHAAGTYQVPALRIEQGGVTAATPTATFQAIDVPDSADMIVRMRLPERDVYVGETFDAAVEWLLAREVESHEFVVPLFALDGATVEAAPGSGRTVRFPAGTTEVNLPLTRGQEMVNGQRYTRFTFPARVTLSHAGTFELDPVQVVARLHTGETRDRFGFRRPSYALFRAEGRHVRLTVRTLPVAGRPASFVNAIGRGFSIEVDASRTVVSVGDPVELTVRVRGDAPLTGLSLPPLDGPDGLPAAHFSVLDGEVAGRIDPESNSKVFTVTVRARSAEAKEIPPVAFSYFDPESGTYRTVGSQPIALSVRSAELVDAGDVVATPASDPPSEQPVPAASGPGLATLVGADMALSSPADTLARPWGAGGDRVALGGLYGGSTLLVLVAWWLARTRERRARRREVRSAFREVERTLTSGAPAREAAPAIVAAMRRLAEVAGADRTKSAAALERLETRAFDPAVAHDKVTKDLVDELRTIARAWAREARHAVSATTVIAVALGVVVIPVSPGVPADSPTASSSLSAANAIDEARTLYAAALEETDRQRRVRRFTAAEQAFRPLAAANPDAPHLQADWGNAALGAGDAGRAVLAYRRALRAMPDSHRARTNLAWLRDRMPPWLPRPATAGPLDSLLFWRGLATAGQLHLIGACAFAIGLMALAGWLLTGRRVLRACAAPALALWVGAAASAWTVRPNAGDAVVVMDDATLRSADSPGAAPALVHPLPAGAEVTIVETRGAWTRIALADGTTGWLAASAVESLETPGHW